MAKKSFDLSNPNDVLEIRRILLEDDADEDPALVEDLGEESDIASLDEVEEREEDSATEQEEEGITEEEKDEEDIGKGFFLGRDKQTKWTKKPSPSAVRRPNMISQGLLLMLGVCSAWGFPQTYQFQRQVVYSPPVLAGPPPVLPLAAQSMVPKVQQPVYIQGQPAFIQQEEPMVYVYSPEAGVLYLRPRVGQRQEGGGFIDSILGFFQNPGNYFPWNMGSTPQQPAESAEGSAPTGEKPEKLQEPVAVAPVEASPVAHMAPGVAAPQPQERFFVGQQLAPLVPSAHQFIYRLQNNNQPVFDKTEIDALGDKAGSAAIAFQKYLALAKLKKQGEREKGEEGVIVEAGERKGAGEEETTTPAVTTTTTELPDSDVVEGQELGPSIAQAKPQAVSVAGPGGVAAAAPVGTAVVGPGGMALSAPTATAVAGAKGTRPGTDSKVRAYFKQAKLPGYYLQY